MTRRLLLFFPAGLLPVLFCATAAAAPKTVRSTAVVDLSFDEPAGDALDHATAGKSRDVGKLVNGARRVDSPFWTQSGKKALLLNALRKQYVRIPDSPDIDRPAGLTVGFFFLNLHPLNDNATRGIFGKRIDGKNASTNFGMNFIGRADSIRPYINDGSGFKYPDFSLRQTVGSRRLVYLTITYEVGDAPGPDTDTDKDDLRIRFFVNGKQVKPKKAVGVILRRNDAWVRDVNFKRLLNNVPLTLGSTNETIEFTSGLIDEFTLFDRALKPKEVARLFREVAGPDGAKLAAGELRPPRSPVPQIATLSTHGLQIGTTSRIVVTGSNLGATPVIRLPFAGLKQTRQSGSTANRTEIDVTIPKDVPAGLYPLRLQSEDGLSAPVTVAIDHLPQRPISGSSAEKPSALPAAFFGEISAAQRQRVYFRGRKGQRIIADVEARRFGAGIDPVVEIKSHRGTPLVIAMGNVSLRGDTRAETVLPRDGLYYAELHDLEYNATGRNPFRLKVGDLKIVDAWYPTAVARGGRTVVRPIGTGFKPGEQIAINAQRDGGDRTFFPGGRLSLGPQPLLTVSDAQEVVEPVGGGKLPAVDATFKSGETQTLAINGIVAKTGESDRYVLNVTGSRSLRFTFLGRAIDSPIDGEVTVRALPQKSVLARGQDRPNSRDPLFNVNVPPQTKQLEVTIRDLFGRGGGHFFYRLVVEPVGRPDFTLSVTSSRLNIPAGGSGFVQLQVTRSGYNGPIKLVLDGAKSLTLLPASIPAGRSGPVFVVVRHRGQPAIGDFRHVRLVGETVGLKPAMRILARTANRTQTVDGWETELPMAIGESSPYSVKVVQMPAALFKGGRSRIGVGVKRDAKLAGYAVRLSTISTERRRPRNPKIPQQGNKPLVRGFPGQAISPNNSSGAVFVAVPLDVAEPEIEFVVRADLVPHPYSARVVATAFSQPFRLAVKSAVAVTVDPKSQQLRGGTPGSVRGAVQRTAGFRSPLIVKLSGLPIGYETKPVVVPGGKNDFAIPVTPTSEAKLRSLPKVTLIVTDRFGGSLLPVRIMPLQVLPGMAERLPVQARKPVLKKE